MKNKKRNFGILLIIVGLIIFYTRGDKTNKSSVAETASLTNKTSATKTNKSTSKKSTSSSSDQKIVTNVKPEDIPKDHKESLNFFAKTLYEYSQASARKDVLIQILKDMNAKPVVANDANDFTGTMSVIRTKNPFPGTRYFHAQYFGGENTEPKLQHMSFEFRPGPNAMAEARAAIEKSFGIKGKPTTEKKDVITWQRDDGYIVWIKKMGLKDLKDDPFNAYSKKDVGVIRVAIEEDIHPKDSEEKSNHQHQ